MRFFASVLVYQRCYEICSINTLHKLFGNFGHTWTKKCKLKTRAHIVVFIIYCVVLSKKMEKTNGILGRRKQGNLLFNSTLNTFLIRLFDVRHSKRSFV